MATLDELRQYIRVSNQEKLEPQLCFRRHPAIPPQLCLRYASAVSNGEPPGSCCENCPIGDHRFCPDVESDRVAISALEFSSIYDHPAHEGYRNHLLKYIFPVLSPSELLPWIARRQVIYDTYRQIVDEELREKRNKSQDRETT